ncbi:MAG: hypothetical protein M3Z16_09620 [Pseudomonadota bacterium]|nr:hypothetical protein [Pseudomonadota bacterium]
MNTPRNLIARLLAAAGAATVTFSLFAGVVSFAEPQRGILIAKLNQHQDPVPSANATVAVAMNGNTAAAR